MVSSGVVNGDKDSAISALGNYNSSLQALDGSWSGQSYTSIMNQADQFLSEYKATIEGGMSAFANACDLYVEYIETKQKIAELRSLASSYYDDKKNNVNYEQEIATLEEKLRTLKQDIEANLASASSSALSASGGNTDIGGLGSADGVQGALTDEQIAKMLEIARDMIGKFPYNSMNYGPDGSGFGCAMFVSYLFNNLLFGGVSGQTIDTTGFYGSCKNFWGNVTNDGFDAHNKGFVEVSAEEAKVGDVICFIDTDGAGTGHDDATSCYHVGIYIGDGKMIHSSSISNGIGEIDINKYLKKRGRGNEYYFIRYVGTDNTNNQAVQV